MILKNKLLNLGLLAAVVVLLTACQPKEEPVPSLETKTAHNPEFITQVPATMDMISPQPRHPLVTAAIQQGPNSFFLLQDAKIPGVEPVSRGHVRFDPATKVNDKILKLRGTTVRKYDISTISLITIYTVAFYAPEDSVISDDIPDVEKVLILEYHLDVEKQKVVEAIHQNVESNPTVNLPLVEPYFQQLSDAFDSPRKGDRYEFVYIPGKGTAMIKAGKVLTVIPTRDFEKAFFGIWLSPHGKDTEMRCELLALPCPPKPSLNPMGAVSSGIDGAKEKLGKLKGLIS